MIEIFLTIHHHIKKTKKKNNYPRTTLFNIISFPTIIIIIIIKWEKQKDVKKRRHLHSSQPPNPNDCISICLRIENRAKRFGFFRKRGEGRGGPKRSFKQRVNYKSRFHEANAITRPSTSNVNVAPTPTPPPIEKRLTNKPWKRGSSRYLQPPVFVIIPPHWEGVYVYMYICGLTTPLKT